ncbi:MAG: hypothetical protein ACTH31_14915, partial [Pseudoclavibacter sp.]
MMLVFGWIVAFFHWVPEIPLVALIPDVFGQLTAAVPNAVFTRGAPLYEGAPDTGAWSLLMFIAAVVLGFASRQGAVARYAVAPAAAVLALTAIPVGIVSLADPLARLGSLVVAAVCLV